MSEQIIILKVMPENIGNEEEIKKKLENFTLGKIQEIRIEPIAFGLKALKIAIMTEAIEGITDKIIEEIKKIDNVKEVEFEEITLV